MCGVANVTMRCSTATGMAGLRAAVSALCGSSRSVINSDVEGWARRAASLSSAEDYDPARSRQSGIRNTVLTRAVTNGIHWQLDAQPDSSGLCMRVDSPKGPDAAASWDWNAGGFGFNADPRTAVTASPARSRGLQEPMHDGSPSTRCLRCHSDQNRHEPGGQDLSLSEGARAAGRQVLAVREAARLADEIGGNGTRHTPTSRSGRQAGVLQALLNALAADAAIERLCDVAPAGATEGASCRPTVDGSP